jgi:hypothetical protein
MSKMKEEYTSTQDAGYEEYVEAQRNELREEGKAELRAELIHAIKTEQGWFRSEASHDQIKFYAFQWVLDLINKETTNVD